jgi:PBP1b-binding outer membrane lipoprotein LpoB
MQNTPRAAFRVITDKAAVVLVIILLSGCVATPSRYRDHNGDFIMNIGSRDKVSPAPAAMTSQAMPSAPSVGRTLAGPGA